MGVPRQCPQQVAEPTIAGRLGRQVGDATILPGRCDDP